MSVFLPEFIRARIMNILAVKQNFINEAIKKLNLKIVKKRKEKKVEEELQSCLMPDSNWH